MGSESDFNCPKCSKQVLLKVETVAHRPRGASEDIWRWFVLKIIINTTWVWLALTACVLCLI